MAERDRLDWLQSYLIEAAQKNLCTRIRCTTCGASEFRKGLLKAAAQASGRNQVGVLDEVTSRTILESLARIDPPLQSERQVEQAVRLVLFDLWTSLLLEKNEHLLAGSWAGNVLERMAAHYKAAVERSKALAEFQDRENTQQRRAEKRKLRQLRHQERLVLKSGRDRIWREGQKGQYDQERRD